MPVPTPSEFSTFTDYAYAVTVARSRKVYPSPFFDIASSYFPTNIKELFKFIKYIMTTNELVNASIEKLSSYPITNLAYYKSASHQKKFAGTKEENLPYLEKWKDLLDGDLQLKSKLKSIGKSYYAYGNAFISLYVPFIRMMHCDKCKKNIPIKGLNYKYQPETKKFNAKCEVCGKISDKVFDQPKHNTKDFNIIVWDPSLIDLDYHPLSDTSEIFYNIHSDEKKRIKGWKDEHFINKTPLSFIQSCYEVKNAGRIKFNRNNVLHLRRELIPGLFPGWGWPLPAVVLKQCFYLQLLRKANETIFEQHILPFIALFPQSTQGLDVYRQVNLGAWKDEVQSQLDVWRRDPASFGIFPFPIGQETIGGQGKAFELIQEANNIAEAIVTGMGIPKEFIFGGLSWSASSVSVRIIENDMLNFREEMLNFPNKFLIPKLAAVLNLPKIFVTLQDFKMADDVQQQQLSFQLMANRVISKQSFFKDSGYPYNYDDEQERIQKEIEDEVSVQEGLAMSQARIQGASQLTQLQYQAVGAGIQAEQQRLQQVPTLPPPPPPPPPDQQMIEAQQMLASQFPADDIQKLIGMTTWQLNDLVAKQKIPPEAMQAVIKLKSISPEQQQMAAQQAAENGGGEGQPPSNPQGGGMPPEGSNPTQDPMAILQQIPPDVLQQLMMMPPQQMDALVQQGQIPPEVAQAVMFVQQQQQAQQAQMQPPAQPAPQPQEQQAMPQPAQAMPPAHPSMPNQPPAEPMPQQVTMAEQQSPASNNYEVKVPQMPDYIMNTLSQIDTEVLKTLIQEDPTDLLEKANNGEFPIEVFEAVTMLKVFLKNNDPASPLLTGKKAKKNSGEAKLPKQMLDMLVKMPLEQLTTMLINAQISLPMFHQVLEKQRDGYVPAEPQQPEQQPTPPQAMPQNLTSVQQAPAVLPPEPPLQPAPQAQPMPQQAPAQQMPPGQQPGGLMPPQQPGQASAPQVPPEYVSPSGVPYSAKELLRSGMTADMLLQIGYSPDDLIEAGVRPEDLGMSSGNVHADVLSLMSKFQGMDPTQYNQAMMMLQQMNPELAQRVMAKTGRMTKAGLDPFAMLKKPGSVNNISGMSTDMESIWAGKDEMKAMIKKILAEKPVESNKSGPAKSKGPNEASPNKRYTQ